VKEKKFFPRDEPHLIRLALAKLQGEGFLLLMVIESMREFNRAVPFKPYEIRTASGEQYVVPHPDFISISAKSAFVVVINQKMTLRTT
jgi:hypothetical protein